jgi:membrane-bound ClpP family serine protease
MAKNDEQSSASTNTQEINEIASIPAATTPPKAKKNWRELLSKDKIEEGKVAIAEEVSEILSRYKLKDFVVLILHDEVGSIASYDANALYSAASTIPQNSKNILLIIHSSGGSIEPAYLIGKTLKRLAKDKFVVAVPRKAKSAATLISLGADEIHMGYVSELGPIDPQINSFPALALGDALDSIADVACRFPAAAEMLGKYLANQAPMRLLGYYKRIGESAVQYAERLLSDKTLAKGRTAKDVAHRLVNHYKDHSFVIDFDEAKTMLGDAIIKTQSEEYKAADEVYKLLSRVIIYLGMLGKNCWYIGAVQDGFHIYDKPKESD